ncbi:MAG TPA: YihY/virulence factor BrkB family protein, partial [Herpetosiphonaceae bacterium]|nr:YihY/virulence factor BrkB family protein [Herpetosiphonaceae bacterium]
LMLAGAAVASYVVEPPVVAARFSSLLQGLVPAGVVDLEPVVTAAIGARGQVGLFAILVFLVSGRRILGALVTALDRVSDVDERDETLRRRALVEVLLLAGIGALFLAALSARWVLGLVGEMVWGTDAPHPLASLVGATVHVFLLVAACYALYTFVPHGERNRRSAFIGAVIATTLFLIARVGFGVMLDSLWASYDLIYGPLAIAALFLTWAWIIGLIVLFGGSLASHITVMLIEGKSAGETEERHVARKAAR